MFVWEAVRPLCYGHVAVLVPDTAIVDVERLVAMLQEQRATRQLTTPSLLAAVVEAELGWQHQQPPAHPPLAQRLAA